MGGQNEKVLNMGSAQSGGREINMGNRIRVHENSGEVHLHDDKRNLKVSVPVADFWREWNAFQTTRITKKGESIHFVDTLRNTVAVIESTSKFNGGKFSIDVDISIMEVQPSHVVSSLRDFVAGK